MKTPKPKIRDFSVQSGVEKHSESIIGHYAHNYGGVKTYSAHMLLWLWVDLA